MAKGSGDTGTDGRSQRTVNQNKQYDPEFEEMEREYQDLSPTKDIRPPAGRAPHGQGKEYAARRWIAGRIDSLNNRAGRLQYRVNDYRGQKNKAYEVARTQQRVKILRGISGQMIQIAESAADWDYKKELIKELNEIAKAEYQQT